MRRLPGLLAPLPCMLMLAACPAAPPKPAAAPTTQPASQPAPATQPAVPQAERWRATPPKPGPSQAPVIPAIQRARLRNGLTVLVSERHDLPLVDVRVALRAGTAAEAQGKGGLADLTYEVMLEGAGKLDGVALAEAFADIGTAAHVATRRDGGAFQVTVLSRHLDRALGLLAQVVRKPRLARADFERRKKRALASLVRKLGSPNYLLWRAAHMAVFGQDHPYGKPSGGTKKSLEALRLTDIRGWHKRHVGPAAAAVIFSGDITLKQATALAKKHLGRWRGRAKPSPRVPAVKATARTRVLVVPKPGLGQTFIAVGRPAVAVGHPQEWTLVMATVAFGGMFTSRLNMNLREDKGYTYGARARARRGHGAGWLVMNAPVQADKTGAALKEIFAEIARLKAKPITAEEFSLARDGSLRSVSGWFESVASMGGRMSTIFQQDLPLDRMQRMVKAYSGMQRAQAQAVADAYYDASLMQVVLVGDPELIKKQVAPLKLGPIEIISIKD